MSDFDRRSVLKVGLGGAALLAGPGIVPVRAAEWTNTPEPNASIRVLRWKQFIQAEFDNFIAQHQEVHREDRRQGAASTPRAGTTSGRKPRSPPMSAPGPTSSSARSTIPFKFPDKLLDLTDLAEYLGAKYGGWYPVARTYGKQGNSWIALPQGATGGCLNYRISAHEGGRLR